MPELKSLKLKICGLRDNINAVAGLHPDYAGFIFYKRSARYVGNSLMADQLEKIPASVKKVGVFVNQAPDEVLNTVKTFQLDYAQLHGDESAEDCHQLHKAGVKIIKVFAGNRALENAVLKMYEPFVDFYLFDTRLQEYGGSGIAFDWNNLRQLDVQKPIFLSGGLDVANVRQIEQLEGVNIHAIDINSKFEISPGLKDIALIEKLKVEMERP